MLNGNGLFFFTIYIHNGIATLHAVHPLFYHRHRMVAVYFLLIEEAMAAGTCIVGLIFYKLLIFSIGEHLVKHKIHNILQVFVVLVFGTFLCKTAQYRKFCIISCHEQGEEQGASFGILSRILNLASEYGFVLMVGEKLVSIWAYHFLHHLFLKSRTGCI